MLKEPPIFGNPQRHRFLAINDVATRIAKQPPLTGTDHFNKMQCVTQIRRAETSAMTKIVPLGELVHRCLLSLNPGCSFALLGRRQTLSAAGLILRAKMPPRHAGTGGLVAFLVLIRQQTTVDRCHTDKLRRRSDHVPNSTMQAKRGETPRGWTVHLRDPGARRNFWANPRSRSLSYICSHAGSADA